VPKILSPKESKEKFNEKEKLVTGLEGRLTPGLSVGRMKSLTLTWTLTAGHLLDTAPEGQLMGEIQREHIWTREGSSRRWRVRCESPWLKEGDSSGIQEGESTRLQTGTRALVRDNKPRGLIACVRVCRFCEIAIVVQTLMERALLQIVINNCKPRISNTSSVQSKTPDLSFIPLLG
jgi:hypothetical protein